MARALYRTYRPQKLADVVGQEHITSALSRALTNGTVSHAYLFTGPRGVGKTSIARILAHEVNGLPYEDDSLHLDIIEIDAASNRRIDEIRDLRDKVHIAPTSAKYKVYIIDEVHMLTKEAFNALLKTLEEPPAHVVFILATTEVHKLPETIISRTQRYAFKPVNRPAVVAHLQHLADAEKITIETAALELIAAHGEGSFRDSISLLDQVRNSGEKVSLADVQSMLGIAPAELIETITSALAAHDIAGIAAQLTQLQNAGHDPAQVARQLATHLRAGLIAGKPALPSSLLLQLLTKLIDVPASSSPKSYLEIALLDTALAGAELPASVPIAAVAPAVSKSKPTPTAPTAGKPAEPKVMQEPVQAPTPTVTEPHPSTFQKKFVKHAEEPQEDTGPTSDAVIEQDLWPQILAALKQKHNTIHTLARTAKPTFGPGTVTLEFAFAFHQKRLNEAKNKQIIAEIVQGVTGENLQIICIVGEGVSEPVTAGPMLPPEGDEVIHNVAVPPVPPAPAASSAPAPAANGTGSDAVAAISNIFGSAEVLES
jgi:DNA polymerase-3 subunit gamma/tau